MGNPVFAQHHLAKIIDAKFNVVAVVSAPDKPSGRGMNMRETSVTSYAKSMGIPCLQPKNLKDTNFQKELKSFQADLQVVVAFRMLPKTVWNMPPMGTINLHASLLPQYRGAAPINWAIINGENETGVTTFRLKHAIDTGGILMQEKIPISAKDNAGSLHDKLMTLGAQLTVKTLENLTNQTAIETPQKQQDNLKNAPKLSIENTQINWNKSGYDIQNLVRGLNPFPTAHTLFDNKKLKVYETSFSPINHDFEAGIFFSDQKKYLAVSVIDGFIYLKQIKLEGKRQMEIIDFINGYDLTKLKPIE